MFRNVMHHNEQIQIYIAMLLANSILKWSNNNCFIISSDIQIFIGTLSFHSHMKIILIWLIMTNNYYSVFEKISELNPPMVGTQIFKTRVVSVCSASFVYISVL